MKSSEKLYIWWVFFGGVIIGTCILIADINYFTPKTNFFFDYVEEFIFNFGITIMFGLYSAMLYKKFTKRYICVIKPVRRYCDCGKKVKNHHFYCDKCYSKRQKRKNRLKKKKRLGLNIKKNLEYYESDQTRNNFFD